jgi:cytochrome c oxidase assembly factor CtaG
MRRILVPLLAFATPFVIFAIYRFLARRPQTQRWPLAILFIAGAVLSMQAFALAALTEPKLDHRPPYVESKP